MIQTQIKETRMGQGKNNTKRPELLEIKKRQILLRVKSLGSAYDSES